MSTLTSHEITLIAGNLDPNNDGVSLSELTSGISQGLELYSEIVAEREARVLLAELGVEVGDVCAWFSGLAGDDGEEDNAPASISLDSEELTSSLSNLGFRKISIQRFLAHVDPDNDGEVGLDELQEVFKSVNDESSFGTEESEFATAVSKLCKHADELCLDIASLFKSTIESDNEEVSVEVLEEFLETLSAPKKIDAVALSLRRR